MIKRILITGGAGFLGSHLCERLLNDDNDIVCLDNFYTGNKDNIDHLLGKPGFIEGGEKKSIYKLLPYGA